MAGDDRAVLELSEAAGRAGPYHAAIAPISLRLGPGDLAMVDVRDERRAAWFADLCSGLVPLSSGTVRILGRDWTAMPPHYAAALRGRIGRVFARGGWIEFADMATNVLLPELHHTRRAEGELRETAARLARDFGLPGLPTGPVSELSELDRARAACVRAFIGAPALLLLESPVQGRFGDLKDPLMNAIAGARSEGAAAVWLAGSDLVWDDPSIPATHRLRLRDDGLRPTRRAA
jgi:phospholipid/cholesterol/gamma-HCH transport system ATP-binding protein